MRTILTLFSPLLWSAFAYSQTLPAHQFLATMPDQALAGALVNEKTKIDAMVLNLGVDTSNLRWQAEAPGKTPSYHPESDTLSIATELGTTKIGSMLTLFVHEYGHAVLERYMLEKSEGWKTVRTRVPQNALEERSKRDRSNDLEFSKLGKSKEEIQTINSEIDRLNKEIKALQDEYNVLVAKQYFMTSYHEFFADTFATLNAGDLNIVRDSVAALGLSHTEDARLSLQWRSFNFDFNQTQMDLWQQQVRRIQGLVGYFNPYDLLAPLRSCFGQKALMTRSEPEKRAMVGSIASILSKDFEARIDGIDATTSTVDPEDINSTLCRNLNSI